MKQTKKTETYLSDRIQWWTNDVHIKQNFINWKNHISLND